MALDVEWGKKIYNLLKQIWSIIKFNFRRVQEAILQDKHHKLREGHDLTSLLGKDSNGVSNKDGLLNLAYPSCHARIRFKLGFS